MKMKGEVGFRCASLCYKYVTMKKMLLVLFLQVALVEPLVDVFGYVGDAAILPSGADPSWNLSSIVWSIFPNNTWIATYRNSMINIERVDRYKGRLSLDTSSGNLMIHNLTTEDDMEYTLHFINTERQNSGNKIKLTVRQHLQKPTIRIGTSRNGSCWLWLHCSSTDENVDVSWQGKFPSIFNQTNAGGNSAVLLVFLNATQSRVEFKCIAKRNTERVTSIVTPTCDDNKPQPRPLPDPQQEPWRRERYVLVFFVGAILGFLPTVVKKCYFKGQRKT